MNYSSLRMARNGLGLSIALTASALAQANSTPVEIIFAAENALYGAGYDIGQADGWMDDTLRAAVRTYQNKHPSLAASGNLDKGTLAMLGVSAESNETISGNSVARRGDALSLLGISEVKPKIKATPKTKPTPHPQPVATAPIETPAKVVAPAQVVESSPSAVTQEPPKPVLVKPAPVPTPEPKPTPVAREPKSKPVSLPTVNYSSKDTSEVEAKPVATVSVAPPREDEPSSSAPPLADEPAPVQSPEAPTAEVLAKESVSEPSQSAPTPPENKPNIFSSLFNFLFGWMG